jgi:hypothetical protein
MGILLNKSPDYPTKKLQDRRRYFAPSSNVLRIIIIPITYSFQTLHWEGQTAVEGSGGSLQGPIKREIQSSSSIPRVRTKSLACSTLGWAMRGGRRSHCREKFIVFVRARHCFPKQPTTTNFVRRTRPPLPPAREKRPKIVISASFLYRNATNMQLSHTGWDTL